MLPLHFVFEVTRNPGLRLAAFALFLIGALLILVKIVATIVLDLLDARAR
jgi:hypothetical protein